jgi:hypothetical protein
MTDKNSKLQKIILHFALPFCILIFAFCIMKPIATNAADLYLESSQDSYSPNEIFKAEIRLNVVSPEDVTAIEGEIKYNNHDLKAIDFLKGNSILTYVDEPKINQEEGIVTFSGIIPGGYTGRLLGDPGESNLLGTIVFQTLKTTNPQTLIEITKNSKILVNAGEELKNNLVLKSLNIKINPQEVVFNPLNELEKAKEEDKIPPEEFKPEIVQINGQYFIVFNTQDKQSGIDHYEVATLKENLLGQLKFISNFKEGESPYPLKEADLNKVIEIKAIDKAGNERIAILYPQVQIKWYQNYKNWIIIIVVIFVLYLLGRVIKSKIKYQKSK